MFVLYAVSCGDFFKVGISGDLKRRIDNISLSNPVDVSVIETWDASKFRSGAMLVESMVHKELTGCGLHQRGEWFKRNQMSDLEVSEKISTIIGKNKEKTQKANNILAAKERIRRSKNRKPLKLLIEAEKRASVEHLKCKKTAIIDPEDIFLILSKRSVNLMDVSRKSGASYDSVLAMAKNKSVSMKNLKKVSDYLEGK